MNTNLFQRILFSIIAAPIVLYAVHVGGTLFNLGILVIAVFGIFEILKLKRYLVKITIFFLFLISLLSFFNIRNIENGEYFIYFILIISWLSDIGGYVFGKIIGGKKIKIISPNKTYSGFIGSLFFSQFVIFFNIYVDFYIFNIFHYNLILIFISSIIVIFGDLFFSFLKRVSNINDFSNLFIGHGGLFDRIDGLIFLLIFYNVFIFFI